MKGLAVTDSAGMLSKSGSKAVLVDSHEITPRSLKSTSIKFRVFRKQDSRPTPVTVKLEIMPLALPAYVLFVSSAEGKRRPNSSLNVAKGKNKNLKQKKSNISGGTRLLLCQSRGQVGVVGVV